jgi:hypothetical protein
MIIFFFQMRQYCIGFFSSSFYNITKLLLFRSYPFLSAQLLLYFSKPLFGGEFRWLPYAYAVLVLSAVSIGSTF